MSELLQDEWHRIPKGDKCNRCNGELTLENTCKDFDPFCRDCRVVKEQEWRKREYQYR